MNSPLCVRALFLLSTLQIIRPALSRWWWTINWLLFHSSGRLRLNTHLRHVHLDVHILSRDGSGLMSTHKHFWDFQPSGWLHPPSSHTSPKALSSSPPTPYPYSFANPSFFILRSPPHSCLLLSSARFHLLPHRRQPRTLYALPNK